MWQRLRRRRPAFVCVMQVGRSSGLRVYRDAQKASVRVNAGVVHVEVVCGTRRWGVVHVGGVLFYVKKIKQDLVRP